MYKQNNILSLIQAVTEQQTLGSFGANLSSTRAGSSKQYKNPDWLREQYKELGLSAPDIADQCDISSGTVYRWLDYHGIETRAGGSIPEYAKKKSENKDWLREEYVTNKRSTKDIAAELGVGHDTVSGWLDYHGIETRAGGGSIPESAREKLEDEAWLRDEYIENENSIRAVADGIGVSTIIVGKWLYNHGIETRKSGSQLPDTAKEKLPNEEWLREEYVTNVRSSLDIAEELKVSATTVGRWLDKHGIDIRSGVQDPDHLEHKVRSNWELQIAELLSEHDISYKYEDIEIVLVDGRIYTPDFITEDYVIEVKGWVRDNRDEEMKAQAAMELLDEREYVVVGAELPCDIHIPWNERERLVEVLNTQ